MLRKQPGVFVMEGKLATKHQDILCPSPALMDLWTKYARSIRPMPRILRQIDDFHARNWSDPMIGVHVRLTDKALRIARSGEAPPTDQSVIDAMRTELAARPNARFFLATDNATSRCRIQEEFGERVRAFPTVFRDPALSEPHGHGSLHVRHTSVEAAVIDLWLLSRTDHILGTRRSSFSVHASVLGNAPLTLL